MSEPLVITPVGGPLDATVVVPGSKSITNRALLCAALATGSSELSGILLADDSEAMLTALVALGTPLRIDRSRRQVTVEGVGGRWRPDAGLIDARLSGTTSRFLLPALALGQGTYQLDGRGPLRNRPLVDLIEVLRSLGVDVVDEGVPGHLPVAVKATGELPGGTIEIAADRTSQFLSALLLVGPCCREPLVLRLTGSVASRPYLDLTLGVMDDFGGRGAWRGEATIEVQPSGYRGRAYAIEPDASSASYFLAAAAVVGGQVTVEGLGTTSRQGDAEFVEVLARMGAIIDRGPGRTTVTGTGRLHGIDVDLRAMPDLAQTLAAVAVFAEGPTRVRGVDIIRHHETDRLGAVVAELRRAGIEADEHADGFTIHPGVPRPATICTYDDHRMAMSFSLLGLRCPGIAIADPGCVSKTFPDYWDVLASLDRGGNQDSAVGGE